MRGGRRDAYNSGQRTTREGKGSAECVVEMQQMVLQGN